MSKTVTLDVSEQVAAAITTPEGMKRAQELLEAEFAPIDPEMIAVARQAITDVEAGNWLSIEDAEAASLAAFEQRLREKNAKAAA